jgi:hypothetical protein
MVVLWVVLLGSVWVSVVPAEQPALYGEVLFADDSPAIVEDANTLVWLSSSAGRRRVGRVQEDGSFELHLLQTEIEQIASGQIRLIVAVPGSADEDFPVELLTSNKARAGVLKVPRPPGSNTSARPQGGMPSPSLKGRPLPSFEGLRPGFDPNRAAGRRLLVCLWDMNQRPSRRMVDELAKRADGLKAAGAQVVLAQISKVDVNDLATWLKARNVPFHAVTATVNEPPLRQRWAYRALPWLILTDPNHVVGEEGFSLDQLDTALKAGDIGTPARRPARAPDAPATEPRTQDPNGRKREEQR